MQQAEKSCVRGSVVHLPNPLTLCFARQLEVEGANVLPLYILFSIVLDTIRLSKNCFFVVEGHLLLQYRKTSTSEQLNDLHPVTCQP